LRSESIRDKGTIRDLGSREYILKIEPAGVSTLNGEREREREREREIRQGLLQRFFLSNWRNELPSTEEMLCMQIVLNTGHEIGCIFGTCFI
jgi:hypothetical protein